jgi:hypothetical protein
MTPPGGPPDRDSSRARSSAHPLPDARCPRGHEPLPFGGYEPTRELLQPHQAGRIPQQAGVCRPKRAEQHLPLLAAPGPRFGYPHGGISDLARSNVAAGYHLLAYNDDLVLNGDIRYLKDKHRAGDDVEGWGFGLLALVEIGPHGVRFCPSQRPARAGSVPCQSRRREMWSSRPRAAASTISKT